jgi:hypothetical protein
MPPIGKDDPMGCLSCPALHSIAESLRDGQPTVIILSDQTFPPVLSPTGDGNCTFIIRVEDCELWELEEVFTDRFKAFCKPHGNLPSGSVIHVGSMSHSAKNRLNFYAPQEPAPKRKNTNDGFPSQYNSIRAARANTSTITPLGGIGGVGRTQVRQGIGAATSGFEVEGDTRQFRTTTF